MPLWPNSKINKRIHFTQNSSANKQILKIPARFYERNTLFVIWTLTTVFRRIQCRSNVYCITDTFEKPECSRRQIEISDIMSVNRHKSVRSTYLLLSVLNHHGRMILESHMFCCISVFLCRLSRTSGLKRVCVSLSRLPVAGAWALKNHSVQYRLLLGQDADHFSEPFLRAIFHASVAEKLAENLVKVFFCNTQFV